MVLRCAVDILAWRTGMVRVDCEDDCVSSLVYTLGRGVHDGYYPTQEVRSGERDGTVVDVDCELFY